MAKYQGLTIGQVEAVVNKMGGVDMLQAFLRGQYVLTKATPTIDKVVEKFTRLDRSFRLKVDSLVNSAEFFTNRKGLWVDANFQALFVDCNVWVSGEGYMPHLSTYTKEKNGRDRQIEKELPFDHVFKAHEFCQILACLLNMEWSGKDGYLNHYGSIFYVHSVDERKVFAVIVHNNHDHGEWVVNVQSRDVGQHCGEYLIFSRH